ncbi:putative ABC transporter ATP-binding protein [Clavibacter michiganensis subsp. michiganensis]|nr:putative ABC transporter ATP-binding protein [Clavibacter michiganensis subsp. michiganensis]
MIHLDDVTLTFPDGDSRITAVDHVTLTAPAGVVTGITGPSGSGKSSILAVAATLIRPDSGRVLIGDVDAATLSKKEATALRRDGIGIVFQQSNLVPSLTAREQLLVMAELGGGRRDRAAVRRRADALLDAVGLIAHAGKRPAQLSGGQRQRVAIARALVNDPSVLLVDEPTSALDQERGAEIMDLIAQLSHQRGTATLLVTHDLVHRAALDRLVTVVDGRIAGVEEAGGARAAGAARRPGARLPRRRTDPAQPPRGSSCARMRDIAGRRPPRTAMMGAWPSSERGAGLPRIEIGAPPCPTTSSPRRPRTPTAPPSAASRRASCSRPSGRGACSSSASRWRRPCGSSSR